MSSNAPRPLPGWLKIAGSVFAVAHLGAIALLALAPPSGPWPTPFGMQSDAEGPRFASSITEGFTLPYYLSPLRMTHNYHFNSNRPAMMAAVFQVTLKDEFGQPIRTLKFPDEKANFWVRHRQSILAQNLAQDQQLPPRGTEVIPAPGQKMPTTEFWERVDNQTMRLKEMESHLVPRDRQVERPSDWSKLMGQSYLRYLCRAYKAKSAELVRVHRPAISPMVLLMPGPPGPENFVEVKSIFGEYRREN